MAVGEQANTQAIYTKGQGLPAGSLDAPANRRIVALVHAAERGEGGGMKGRELLAALGG